MHIIRKDAAIVDTSADGDFPGTFDVILSTEETDRDGDTLMLEDWLTPLPDHITFDQDHGMTVASTVGSGAPSLDEDAGTLVVSGSYSSLQRGQDVRTLVKEKHIRTVSVAFMNVPDPAGAKDAKGKTKMKRELLNGAFVAVPSNRGASITSSKSAAAGTVEVKVHDPLDRLADATTKTVAGSLEATQERIRDALREAYPHQYPWLRATMPTEVVFELDGYYPPEDAPAGVMDYGTYRQAYSDDGTIASLTGDATAVELMEVIKPEPSEAKSAPAPAPEAPAQAAPSPAEDAAQDEDAEVTIRAARIAAYAAIAEAATA